MKSQHKLSLNLRGSGTSKPQCCASQVAQLDFIKEEARRPVAT